VNKKTLRKLERKEKALRLKKQGFSVKVIAKKIGVSNVNIYRYFQEEYDKKHYPELKKINKKLDRSGREFQQVYESYNYLLGLA
jgi:DNA invertase Pin-like site-specific DNA recombinase